ncbi:MULTISPECIES: TetR/AcrR family transcriptional regulator [Sinorhizobium]|jgi:AcrR family transcriptional regulator|uniref:TetR/AcrR family transcriptional regulator n=1 Tax=Sinorhizobium TaxID=28105 RepID=UPI000380EDBA|nr:MULTISPECIES: TetR/AcrR family transcriptional regulator [Sinorhizobium]PND22656.1 TetR/AcrR family transcriptional regulator [Ensifer sp. MMN_5]MCG5482753.1 TetR/AcrR family transcriptional regulator [Sinorhizobium meliloti]PND26700.1 TetR/AcrR family transcriptional regulator [Sinorhizobium sp. M4_45]RVQ04520.1 TetR/AcrR family transcriptional regulator [Sinorhizobium meliloti]WRQ67707.1 TetR/AcrR family transcriptional regulator [Sinorhizobium meliloti]
MDKIRGEAKGRSGSGGRAERALQRDPERTRASILAAATREFAENGIGGARVDSIAERAGINKRMLYHYFGDKEQLYLAVLEEAYVGIRTAEKSLNLSDLEPEQGIAELAMFTWDYFLEHPEFLSLLGTENLHRARWLRQSTRLKELHSSFIDKLSDLLRRGKAEGLFRPDVDPLNLYLTIAALGYFYLSNQYTLSTIFGRDLMDKSNLDVWKRHIVHVTLASIRR